MVWGATMSRLDLKDQYDYHKHISVYVIDHIKFADAKAGITLGLTGVIFSFFSKILHDKFNKLSSIDFFTDWAVYHQLASLACLGIGIYYLAVTIWPRYYIHTSVYQSWGGIAAFDKGIDYRNALSMKFNDEQSFLNDMSEQNYALAKICKTKFMRLRLAFWFVGIGVAIGGIAWFFG